MGGGMLWWLKTFDKKNNKQKTIAFTQASLAWHMMFMAVLALIVCKYFPNWPNVIKIVFTFSLSKPQHSYLNISASIQSHQPRGDRLSGKKSVFDRVLIFLSGSWESHQGEWAFKQNWKVK